MKQNVSVNDFRDAFTRMNRNDNFSYDGLGALFDYLEDYEESTGEEMELDVVALCCDFTEYKNALPAAEDYGFEVDDSDFEYEEDETDGGNDFEEEKEEQALEFLKDNTAVIEIEGGGVIVQAF